MTGHPYCRHDEDEPCDCAATLAVRKSAPPTVNPLTAAQRAAERLAAVHRLTADGCTAKAIAGRLGITETTVYRLRRTTPEASDAV